jgi:hypothetical protein
MRATSSITQIRATLTKWFPLLLVSAMSLYLELAVIRWIAGEVPIFSYFKNLTLLAAFLGLAIGFGVVNRRDLRSTYSPLLAGLFIVVIGIKYLSSVFPLVYPGGGEEVLLWFFSSDHWLALILFLGSLLILFLMVMFTFVPIGQAVAMEMEEHSPLPAYVVNIIASLVGVWLFALTSASRAPPVFWFGFAGLGFLVYQARRGILTKASIGLQVGVLVGLVLSVGSAIWSPYQKLMISDGVMERASDSQPVKVGYLLDTQVGFHQQAYDLSPDFLATVGGELPELEMLANYYDFPYRFISEGSEILIVGAGMGNDVAAALRAGVRHIDAVEIDPGILESGALLHPERPYDDDRVTPILDDARSFIRKSPKKYDAIVFGLLDSHTLLSSLSSVRLDSFVYTEESFRAVHEHLRENGVASVSFLTVEPWMDERLGRILADVFGPDQVYAYYTKFGTTFLAGAIDPSLAAENEISLWKPDPSLDSIPIPTDDWPYLYLQSNRLPSVYWQVLLVIGIVCLVILAFSFPEVLRPDWHFWFLGAAFLLIEFKSITELALLFGTTWLVNAIAISGVLIMILFANIVVLRSKRVEYRIAFPLLIISIVFLYFFPIHLLNKLSFLPRLLASGGLLSLPLFFSGLIFGESLRRAGETSIPLKSNLSGAMIGGLLEYGSLVWGIKSLYVMAIGLYLLAWLGLRFHRRS